MDLVTKTIQPVAVKFLDSEGDVSAEIATLNIVDKDGDVTLPGFFGTQEVAIAWAHDWTSLVGKGILTEDGDKAVFTGRFFTDTMAGTEAYKTVKNMADLQEWSYGFRILEGGQKLGQHDGRDVRFLKPQDDGAPGAKVSEVSPVLVGAGEGTRTVGIKSADDRGLRFVDHATFVAQEAELLAARAGEIAALRGEKGIGAESADRIKDVQTRLNHVAEALGATVSPMPNDDATTGAASAFIQAQRTLADIDSIRSMR